MAKPHLQAVIPVMEIRGTDMNADEENSDVVVNHWTAENENTLRQWLHNADMTCFIYNDTAEWYEKLMTIITVLTVILSGVVAALSVVALALGNVNIIWVFVLTKPWKWVHFQ